MVSRQDRVRWRCQAGDIGVTLSALQGWAHLQRLHLCEYLPHPRVSSALTISGSTSTPTVNCSIR
jgi:hypothetical protein